MCYEEKSAKFNVKATSRASSWLLRREPSAGVKVSLLSRFSADINKKKTFCKMSKKTLQLFNSNNGNGGHPCFQRCHRWVWKKHKEESDRSWQVLISSFYIFSVSATASNTQTTLHDNGRGEPERKNRQEKEKESLRGCAIMTSMLSCFLKRSHRLVKWWINFFT